jgi:hypothetical protein
VSYGIGDLLIYIIEPFPLWGRTLRNMTPEEAFTGVKPEVGHFRIFGCLYTFMYPRRKGPS